MERTRFDAVICTVLAITCLVLCVDLSSSQSTREYCQRRENMTFAPCADLHTRNITHFPNFLGHQTMRDAVLGFNYFHPYLESECSPDLRLFLCVLYFTWGCDRLSRPVFPCRDLCERVRDDCSGAFRVAGTAWPDSLDCDKFGHNSPENICLSYLGNTDESAEDVQENEAATQPPAPTLPPPGPRPDPRERCHPHPGDPICRSSVPYASVIFPNVLGQDGPGEALLELHRYGAFLSEGGPCPELLRTYMCLAYLPPCKIVEGVAAPVPPCRTLCEMALTESCLNAMAVLKMDLRTPLKDCSMYPEQSSSYPTCYVPGGRFDPLAPWSPPPVITDDLTSHCRATGCVDVLHAKCHSLGFWVATFPNLLGQADMQRALAELDRLEPFVHSGCSDKLEMFACFAFFASPKSDDYDAPLPCQSVCHEIWRSCRKTAGELFEKRPRMMTCRLYPKENCDSEMSNRIDPITIFNASRVNLTHALVEFADVRLAYYNQVSKWGVRGNALFYPDRKEIQEGYFELYDLFGAHVVLWPWNAYGRGSRPSVAWIPPHDNKSIPDHCEQVDIMHCRKLGFTAAEFLRDRFWYWEAPEQLLSSWRDYFPEETVGSSAAGCLPRLHELFCSLMAPPCTASADGPIVPCREFCKSTLKQCNASSGTDGIGWLLESLPCDRLLSSTEGTCYQEFDWRPSEAVIRRELYYYDDETVKEYCLVPEDEPNTPPEFYGPDGNLIPMTSPNDPNVEYSTGRHVIELSPRLTLLYFNKVSVRDIGTYTCKAAGGKVLRTTEVRPLAKCIPSFNHTLCGSISSGGAVLSPNVLGHTTQYQAELASYNFLPLLATGCSPDLLELVCALYAPECPKHRDEDIRFLPMQPMTLPSQRLCREVKRECAEAAGEIGFRWPSEVQCDKMGPSVTNGGPSEEQEPVVVRKRNCISLRRYDITDLGIEYLFYGWVDVQGQGAANDYCRVVSIAPFKTLSCALAGTQGESQFNYNSPNPQSWFDLGHPDTWYMRDRDGDGRDDYCRCVGAGQNTTESCLRAGPEGFQNEFTPEGALDDDCRYVKVNKLFGPSGTTCARDRRALHDGNV